MYTGTLIDDLMATVKRAKERAEERAEVQRHQEKLVYWHEAQTYEFKVAGQDLLGVA